VEENKTGYHAENIKFVSTDENPKKSPHFYIVFLYLPEMYCHAKAMLVPYQLVITFMLCCG